MTYKPTMKKITLELDERIIHHVAGEIKIKVMCGTAAGITIALMSKIIEAFQTDNNTLALKYNNTDPNFSPW